MLIVETSIFTKHVQTLLTDNEYRLLQQVLVINPKVGVVIPGSGGLRKIRWSIEGRGKRGGVRVIYYWASAQDQLLMLEIYAKNELDDLTPLQLKVLRRIVEEQYP